MSLTQKVAVCLALVLSALAAVYVGVTRHWEQTLQNAMVQEVRQVLGLRSAGLGKQVRQARQTLTLLARQPGVAQGQLPQIRALLAQWEAVGLDFDALYYVTSQGAIHSSSGDPFTVRDTAPYERLSQGLPVLAAPRGQPILLLSALVPGVGQPDRGHVVGSLLVDRLRDLVESNLKDESARLLIFDDLGAPLSATLAGEKDATQASMATLAVGEWLRGRSASAGGDAAVGRGERLLLQGEWHWVFEQRVPELGWQLIYLKPESVLLGSVQQVRRVAWLLGGCLLGLAVLALWLLRRQYLQPLQNLLQAQQRVSQGERSVRIGLGGGAEVLALQTSFNMFPYPITIARLSDNSYVDVNPAFCQSRDLPYEALVGSECDKGQARVDHGVDAAFAAELVAKGRLDSKAVELVNEQGVHQWVMFSTRLLELRGEQLAMSVAVDITELKNSETKQAAIFNSSPVPMLVVNRQLNHQIVAANDAWLKLFAYQREDVTGSEAGSLGLWAQPERRRAFLAQIAQTGEVHDVEEQFLRKDGTAVTCRLQATQLKVGKQSLLIVTQEDVTAMRAAQAALQLSEKRFRDLFDASPVPQFIYNQRTEAMETNRRWDEMIGFSATELQDPAEWWLRSYPDPVLREQKRREWFEYLARASELRTDIPPMEQEIYCRDELWRHVQTRVSFAGENMIVSMQDITDLKVAEGRLQDLNATLEQRVQLRTEELAERNSALVTALQQLEQSQQELARQEKLASLGALVAGVSHELNTPIGNARVAASTLLSAGKDMTQALEEGKLTKSGLKGFVEKVTEGAVITERNLIRASDLITSFKHVAVDQSSLARRPYAMHELVHEVMVVMQPTIKSKHVQLQTDVPEGLRLDGYPGSLTQVLINLINNAVVHGLADRDSGRIVIRARLEGEQEVVLEVEDNGCGIPPAHRNQVFDPFFTTKLGQGGSGLGLNIVLNTVQDALGGRIRLLEPGVEGGARFEIRLPTVAPLAKV